MCLACHANRVLCCIALAFGSIYFSHVHGRQSISDSIALADSLLQKGEHAKARNLYRQQLETAENVNDPTNKKLASLGLARALHLQGILDEALSYYLKAFDHAAMSGDSTSLANASMGIGIVYSQTKNYHEAERFLKKALAFWPSEDIKRLQILINLGNVYMENQQDSASFLTYRQALAFAHELNAPSLEAVLHTNLSNHYSKVSDWPASIFHARRSLQIRDSLKQPISVITYNNLGYALVNSGKVQEGMRYYRNALPHASSEERKQLWYNLKDAAILVGDYTAALAHFEAYDQVKDSIATAEYEQRVMEITTAYETAEKESRIRALEGENRIKNRQITWIIIAVLLFLGLAAAITYLGFKHYRVRRELENSQMQNKLLQLQLNPHFIFNALQHIQQYLYRNDTANSMDYLSRFSRLMRLILEHSDEEWIDLDEEVEMLDHYLRLQQLGSGYTFEYQLTMDPQLKALNGGSSIRLPVMLLHPFVENAVIHGVKKRDNGLVTIVFGRQDNYLNILITDNGAGLTRLPDKSRSNMHRSMGTSIINQRIAELNKQFNGLITLRYQKAYEDSDNAGTTVHLQVLLKQNATLV